MNLSIGKSSFLVCLAGFFVILSAATMLIRTGGTRKPAVHPNQRGFNTAILWFELLESPDEVFMVLGDPSTPQGMELRSAMDALNKYDFLFMASYSALYAALFLFLNTLLGGTKGPLDRAILISGVVLSVLMLTGDLFENLRLLELTRYAGIGEVPQISMLMLAIWTRVKWFSIFIASILLAAQYLRYFSAGISGVTMAMLFVAPSVAGFTAILFPGIGFLLEAGSNVLGAGWIAAIIHAFAVFLKRKGSSSASS